jgi:transcriptional regulator with XRE-family HTH domain
MKTRRTFAEALKEERTLRGHTTRQAGEVLEVTNATVSNWERGALPLQKAHWLALMEYLSITKEEFADLIAETAKREHLARFVIEGL